MLITNRPPVVAPSTTSRPAPVAAVPAVPESAPVGDSLTISSTPQQEASSPVLDRFREVFFTDYEARKCGMNIRHFITRFPEPEHLEDAKVLGITNQGLSWFGMTRAMHTRDTNFKGEMRVTDSNWYHHVVLEKDGRIYDFDYGITPKAPTVAEYFDKMFLHCDKVSAADKLKDYEVQVIDAQEYAKAGKDTSTKARFKDYLGSWGVNLERYNQPAKK